MLALFELLRQLAANAPEAGRLGEGTLPKVERLSVAKRSCPGGDGPTHGRNEALTKYG